MEARLPARAQRIRNRSSGSGRYLQIRVARVARYHRLRGERGGSGRLQDLQDAAGAPGVGPHHVLDLRFRGAGVHPDRQGQRDEQQLVGGEHPRTNPCGEQALPPYGSCLLGSVNLTRFVIDPFTDEARFDWETYRNVVKVFTRMLDNVVEINGLPLAPQRDEITRKRRHGMGFLGLGSTITMLCMKYGSKKSVAFSQNVSREMAIAGWEAGLDLAREKGPAPIMNEEFTVTREMLRKRPEMARDGWKPGARIPGRLLLVRYSRYMQRIASVAPQLIEQLAAVGARFTHHTSIAPTGTISLSLANNA